jgi:hypothetical protein
MSITKGLTLIVLLAAASSLQARDIDFNYVQGTIGIFDLDVDESFDDGIDSINIETDDDISYDAEGAWQPFAGANAWYDNVHFFAAIGSTENDLEVSGTILGTPVSVSGSIDIFRVRGGVGYGYPVNEQVNLYGRVTWDYVELEDINLGGASTDDVDDNGVGFEGGARWLFSDDFELQGYLRYTDVGALDDDGDADDDLLVGVNGRWYFADRWAVTVNGEFGDTYLYGAGVRFDF